MTRTRFSVAVLLGITLAADAPAQFIVPAISQPGIEFRAGGKRLGIRGFIPTGDPYGVLVPVMPTASGFQQVGPAFLPFPNYGPPIYGAIDQRVTLQIINPPVVKAARRGPDLSGIDLDVEPASKIWGDKNGGLKKGELVKAPQPPKKEVAKIVPPEEKKPAVVAKPPAPPKAEPIDGERLMDLGTAAFRNGDFGLAVLRYRNAAADDVPAPRALFLQGQAYLAVGKYREAAESIQRGLKRQPHWPISGFMPKVELYDKNDELWTAHRKTLEAVQKGQPKNADLLFLLGYLAWFDGQRDAAVDYFQQARALAAEPRWADAFLRFAAAKK